MTITVIHGPGGTGKSHHKAAFAAHYGCTYIVEDWSPHDHELPDDNRLVLTTSTAEAIRQAIAIDCPAAHVRIVSIYSARVAIGVPEYGPTIGERLSK